MSPDMQIKYFIRRRAVDSLRSSTWRDTLNIDIRCVT